MMVKLEWLATVWWKNYDAMLSRFHLIPERNGQTDRQICYINIARQYADARFILNRLRQYSERQLPEEQTSRVSCTHVKYTLSYRILELSSDSAVANPHRGRSTSEWVSEWVVWWSLALSNMFINQESWYRTVALARQGAGTGGSKSLCWRWALGSWESLRRTKIMLAACLGDVWVSNFDLLFFDTTPQCKAEVISFLTLMKNQLVCVIKIWINLWIALVFFFCIIGSYILLLIVNTITVLF